MIGIIGYQDDTIGFGLTGISQMIELTKNSNEKEIQNAIIEMKKKVDIIIINESLLNKVRQEKEIQNTMFIEIPEDKEKTNLDEIESLIKDTLGIKF
ncbi:MAG: V-type ATP synthase subunit F [Candidatus Woesearchaeota archaeon]